MQPEHPNEFECYCLNCHEPTEESAVTCTGCGASFGGSGAFDKLRGPRPSSLFLALFVARPARAA